MHWGKKWLCISVNLPHSHVWNTVVMSELVHLIATWNCYTSYRNKYAGLLVLYLLLLLSPWLIVKMWPAYISLFYRDCFRRCSSQNWPNWFHFLFLEVGLLNKLHDFPVSIPVCYKDVYVNSFFPHTARFWNTLSIECFSLTYDRSGFKFRINRHILTIGSF